MKRLKGVTGRILIASIALMLPACDLKPSRSLPPPPIMVRQRKALIAGGDVAGFTNQGDRTLSVLLTFENPSFKRKKTFPLVLAPGETKQIGTLEGWTVVPGETVEISCDGYRNTFFIFKESK